MKDTTVFIHGLEGSSEGKKARFFRQRYPHMIIEDFRGTLRQRMDKLEGLLAAKDSVIIVGSSYGGLMAAIYAFKNTSKVKKLILLAPALAFHEFQPYAQMKINTPVVIYHGRQDEVLPLAAVRENAHRVFENLAFHAVDDDHVLSHTFESMNWNNLLSPICDP